MLVGLLAERLQPCHPSLQQQVAAGINAAKPAVRCARAIAVQRIQRLIRPTANSIRPSRQQCAEGAMAAADEPGSTACAGTPLDSSWKQFYAKACGMQSGVSMAQLHQGMQLLTSTKGQYTQHMQPSPGLHVMQWWMRTAASPTHLSAADVALAAPIIADAGQLERQRHRKQAVLNIPPPCTPLQDAAIDGTDRAAAKANACVRLTSSSAQLQLQMLADDRSPAFGKHNPLTHGLLGNGPAMQSDPSPSHAHDASPGASSPAGSQTMVREWPAQLKRVHGKSVASHIGISSQQASMCTSAEHVAAGSKLPIVSVSSQDQHVLYDGTAAGACKETQLAVDLGHASVGDGFDVDVWLPGVSMQLMGALFN